MCFISAASVTVDDLTGGQGVGMYAMSVDCWGKWKGWTILGMSSVECELCLSMYTMLHVRSPKLDASRLAVMMTILLCPHIVPHSFHALYRLFAPQISPFLSKHWPLHSLLGASTYRDGSTAIPALGPFAAIFSPVLVSNAGTSICSPV